MSTKVPDSWDDEEEVLPAAASLSGNRVKGEKQKIKDDWDDDEEDEEESQNTTRGASSVSHSVQAVSKPASTSTQTTKILSPAPKSASLASSIGSSFPPELSFEPAVRILKRPKPSESQTSTSSSNNERQTLQEREERYRLARERIFGSSPDSSSPNERGSSPVSGASTPVISLNTGRIDGTAGRTPDFARPSRDPLGPGSQTAFTRKPGPGHSVPSSLSQDV